MTESPQDHPGPEWVEYPPLNGQPARFSHPGLQGLTEWYGYDLQGQTRLEAVARCRVISAAALAWEVKKREALAAAKCEREEI